MKKLMIACFVMLFALSIVNAQAVQGKPKKSVAPGLQTPVFSKRHKTYKVIRVIDGDTFAIQGKNGEVKIRFAGVDAPELAEIYGKESSTFTYNLLKGKSVYVRAITKGQKYDKDGCGLAYVYRAPDGMFVNAEIIRQGYGRVYTKYPFKHEEDFKQLEQFARNTEKGLWSKEVKTSQERKNSNEKTAVTMPSHRRRQWAIYTAELDKMYQVEEFRLFYTTDGKHALPKKHQKDINKNNTPDYIEDIAAQLVTAKYIYLNVLELKHPFEGTRYKGRVKYFDVDMLGEFRVNGSAGSRVVRYYRSTDPEDSFPVLTIKIKNTIDVTNLTPAHELFHEFQYGYTLFKNKWYLEGMARFSQYLFKSEVPPTTNFPSSKKERDKLLQQSYKACSFWQMMFASIQDRREFKVPEKIKQRKYITVNKRIFEGGSFNAVHAFKLFLEEYDKVDDEVSRKAGLNPIIWGDRIQKAKRNNIYLWPATLRVYRKLSNKLVSNSHYKNTEQPTKASDIFLELDKYTLGDVREILNEGRVLGAADGQVSKIVSNSPGNLVWRILYDLPEGMRVRLSLKHAASGGRGGFRFTAWSDTDGNGVPDTKIGSSAEMTAKKDQWSDWEFVATNRAVFAGVEKEKKTSLYYQMGGKLEGYFGLSNRVFYSRHPGDSPVYSTQPRYANLRVELLGK